MQKIFFYTLSALFFFSAHATNASGIIPSSVAEEKKIESSTGILVILQNIEDKKQEISELENTLNITEEKIFPLEKEKTLLEKEYNDFQTQWGIFTAKQNNTEETEEEETREEIQEIQEIEKIEEKNKTFLFSKTLLNMLEIEENTEWNTRIDTQKKKIIDEKYPEKIKNFDISIQEKKKIQKEEILSLKEQLNTTEKELVFLQEQKLDYFKNMGIKTSIFLAIFLFLFFIQSISSRFLEKISEKYEFSDQRVKSLKSLKKWIFNIIYISVILLFFSSQFLSFLPFLALLGTAIAFALRDILSSFIGWFLIGTKEGFKEGDVIRVGDNIFGRVVKIGSFLTQIQELGMNGATGKYLTFPNRKIFDGEISSYLKRKGFLYIAMDFYLTADSNIQKAKTLLAEVIAIANEENMSLGKKEERALKKMGILLENMQPKVFLNITPHGVFIRGKMFVHFDERHDTKTKVTQLFLEKLQQENDISLRFLDMMGQ